VEKFGEKVDKSVLLALLPCQRESVGRKKKEDAQLPAERVCFEEKLFIELSARRREK
jgi:hypothetical protein